MSATHLSGPLYVGGVQVIDENGNVDAPVTTTDLTTSGNTTIGDAAADTLDINATISDDFLVGTDKKIQFRDTGLFIHSSADGKLLISADGGGADDITLTGGLTVTNNAIFSSSATFSSGGIVPDDQSLVFGTDTDISVYYDEAGNNEFVIVGAPTLMASGVRHTAQLVTSTADGLTTGLITLGWSFVSVTSADANNIVTLPAGTAGQRIVLKIGATGCELRTPAGSNATINNSDCDGTNELALAANATIICLCVATNTWIAYGYDNAGAALATLTPDAA